MLLLIVRHATAVARGTPGLADDDRPLTPRGEKRFKQAARGLARVVARPDAVLTSPLPRARRTAEIAAAAWGKVEPKDEDALARGSVEDVIARLEGFAGDACVALFGHEPQVSELLARLVASRRPVAFGLRKGGAALVELPGQPADGGRLVWMLPPKVLRSLAK